MLSYVILLETKGVQCGILGVEVIKMWLVL